MIIDRMGPRNVLVRNPALTDNDLNEIRRQSLGVSLRDAAIIEDGVPGVELTAPRVEVAAYMIMAPGAQTQGKLIGVSHHQDEISSPDVVEGRFIGAIDENAHAQMAVIGSSIRRDLFGSAGADYGIEPTGKKVQFDGYKRKSNRRALRWPEPSLRIFCQA